MEYRAVGNRCAVSITNLNKVAPQETWASLLNQAGFSIVNINIADVARSVIGKAVYRRSARPSEAPNTFDCSSLIKWVLGKCGVWLPRRTIQQPELGERIELSDIEPGDVVFKSGFIDYFIDDPSDGVGHVGIYTDKGTVIHAANKKVGVIECDFPIFSSFEKLRGIRRYIPRDGSVLILETPAEREVEIEDDVIWILRQNLPR